MVRGFDPVTGSVKPLLAPFSRFLEPLFAPFGINQGVNTLAQTRKWIGRLLLMTRKCKHAILVLSKIGRSEKALF